MAVNDSGSISQRTATRASARLLDVGQPMMLTQRFAMVDDQPKKTGKTVTWRRYESFPTLTAPAAEGVTPPEYQITYTDVSATLQEYVSVVPISAVVQDTHEDPVLRVMTQRIGEQMARTVETVTFAVLKGGSNAYYANAAANRAAVNSPVTRGDLQKVVRGFDRTYAAPISELVSPSSLVSTSGVEPAFYALGHTDLEPDLRAISGFKPVVEYSNPGQAVPGEVGAFQRVRFCLSALYAPWLASGLTGTTYLSNGSPVTVTAQCDVYPLVIVARDAYGVVRLQGRGAARVMVVNPTPSAADPAAQRGYVSAKIMYTGARLNESWIARIECACTANPT